MLAEVHTEGRLLEAVLVLVKPGARGPARAALGDHLAPLWSLLRVWGTLLSIRLPPFPQILGPYPCSFKDYTESQCFSLSKESVLNFFFLYSRHLREEGNVVDLIWGLTKKHEC